MKRALMAASFALASFAASAAEPQPAGSVPDAATRAAIVAVKQGIVEGHRRKDAKALDALYADDYVAVDPSGETRTKAQLLASLATDPEMLSGQYALTSVRVWGDTAVASGKGRFEYRNADGTTRVSEYGSVNVFRKRDGRWLYVAAFFP